MLDDRLMGPGELGALLRVGPKRGRWWADNSLVESEETPGGHRRFRESVVRRLVRQPTGELVPLLLPREVADQFGVDPRTVIGWVLQRLLPSVRTPGGHHRFQPAIIEARRRALTSSREAT